MTYDVIVYGASGFTGEFIAKEISKYYSYSFAIAGRSQAKLQKIADSITTRKPDGIIIADVKNENSLLDMCKQGKLIINAVGPYRFYGIPVMKAAVESSCHYVDISGEPYFIELAEFQLNHLAEKNNVYAISACGFDSIPSDMGVEYTRQQFLKKYPKAANETSNRPKLNEIQAYLSFDTSDTYGYTAHATTLECAVHGFSTVRDLIKLRKESKAKNPLLPAEGPRGAHKKEFHAVPESKNSKIAIKFPGSDRSIVLRSQQRIARYTDEKRQNQGLHNVIQFFMYATMTNSIFTKLKGAIFGFVLTFLTKWAFWRNQIIKYPKFYSLGAFSHEGPSLEQVENTKFHLDFYGKGVNGAMIKTRVSGPDPGYIGTAAMVSCAAATILEDEKMMPGEGGVMTTAFGFRDTKLYERLEKRGLVFETLN